MVSSAIKEDYHVGQSAERDKWREHEKGVYRALENREFYDERVRLEGVVSDLDEQLLGARREFVRHRDREDSVVLAKKVHGFEGVLKDARVMLREHIGNFIGRNSRFILKKAGKFVVSNRDCDEDEVVSRCFEKALVAARDYNPGHVPDDLEKAREHEGDYQFTTLAGLYIQRALNDFLKVHLREKKRRRGRVYLDSHGGSTDEDDEGMHDRYGDWRAIPPSEIVGVDRDQVIELTAIVQGLFEGVITDRDRMIFVERYGSVLGGLNIPEVDILLEEYGGSLSRDDVVSYRMMKDSRESSSMGGPVTYQALQQGEAKLFERLRETEPVRRLLRSAESNHLEHVA